MEDTLRGIMNSSRTSSNCVLILVLMEDTLRGYIAHNAELFSCRLNPCFNGRYSQSAKTEHLFYC